MITDLYYEIIDKLAKQHKTWLMRRKFIKNELEAVDDECVRQVASVAFTGTTLEKKLKLDGWISGLGKFYHHWYSDEWNPDELVHIPPEIASNLKQGTLPDMKIRGVNKSMLEKIQHRFNNGYKTTNLDGKPIQHSSYKELKNNRYLQIAHSYIRRISHLLVSIFIIIVLLSLLTVRFIHDRNVQRAIQIANIQANMSKTYSFDNLIQVTIPCNVNMMPVNYGPYWNTYSVACTPSSGADVEYLVYLDSFFATRAYGSNLSGDAQQEFNYCTPPDSYDIQNTQTLQINGLTVNECYSPSAATTVGSILDPKYPDVVLNYHVTALDNSVHTSTLFSLLNNLISSTQY